MKLFTTPFTNLLVFALLALFVVLCAELILHGRTRVLLVSRRLCFLFGLLIARIDDRAHGRAVAVNSVMTPSETSRGTQSLIPDAGTLIGFRNAVVKIGSDDHHFAPIAAYTDIPRGILFNDQVDAGEADDGSGAPSIKKQIALFGLYDETLPCVASGAIAVDAEVVADPANPGKVKTLPTAPGTYVVLGRSRFTVAANGDPVSLIHHTPVVRVVS